MLTASQEAALIGRSRSAVSRARAEPDHPANRQG
jgi:hypothetical protein